MAVDEQRQLASGLLTDPAAPSRLDPGPPSRLGWVGPSRRVPGHEGLREPSAERDARRALRGQVARLERELGDALLASFPGPVADVRVPATGGPRLLTLSELERLRDELALCLRDARRQVAGRADFEAANRALLERMLRDPKRHRFCRLAQTDLGEHGCGVYEVRPRLGLIGMLAGWWQVKLSSGCP